ncbi:MAG: glycosyltransferase [Candidatus Eremiobacteraeota bacterium]|nr:glycosyltransferase [Candidatus Eremiobacteraeota bacterium]
MTESAGRAYWFADITASTAATQVHDTSVATRPYDDAPLDITFFVSCYNEAAHIVETLDTICGAVHEVGMSFEILVIDDGSKDNSRELVRQYIAEHPGVNILLRANKKNRGLAQNYVDGAFIGRGKFYRLICGDSSEPKETIVTILRTVGEADCIVPYYASHPGRSAWRHGISKTYTFIINSITGNRIQYYNGLAVHLRHNVMRWHTNTRGFGFQAEILCLLLDLGFTYKEIPVVSVEQRHGKSNALTVRNLLSVAHTIIEIANRRISGFVYSSR